MPLVEAPAVEQLDPATVTDAAGSAGGSGDRWEIPADWFTDPTPTRTDPNTGPGEPGDRGPEGWNP